MKKTIKISIQTGIPALEKIFHGNNGSLPVDIDRSASKDDLRILTEKHQGTLYYKALLQNIVNHAAADEDLLLSILRNTRDSGIRNAIATSPRTSRKILTKLAKSRDHEVSEHAKLALIAQEIPKATSRELADLIRRHLGDSGIDLGVRMLVAKNKNTPISIIKRLSKDDADFIREAARLRLTAKPS